MPTPRRRTSPEAATSRASDEDRERAAERLRDSFATGRLSADELSERLDGAYAARTVAELEALTIDLREGRPAQREPLGPVARGLRVSLHIHLWIYAMVNLMLIAIWAASGGGSFWPIWPILGWGIGVAGHAAPVIAGVGTGTRQRRLGPSQAGTQRAADPPSVDALASSVAAERPSLRPAAAPDGTVTILFSDVEDSTAHNERLGDLRWLELLRAHNTVVREQVAAHGGFEVKTQGDSFMVAFSSARRAVQCARAMQHAVATVLAEHPDGPIRLRIGLHTGEAIKQEADFYGKNVVLAARIAGQADGGEILVSSVVKELTDSAGDVHFEDEREIALKGLAGTHRVFTVTGRHPGDS